MINNEIKKVYDIVISTDAGVVHIIPSDSVSISITKELPKLENDILFIPKKDTFKVEGDCLSINFIT